MDYMIRNHKNVYIKLSPNGRPDTCGEGEKGEFEYSKARNILDNLPKTLKKLNFKVEAIPQIENKATHNLIDKAVIKDLSSNITCWIEKFGTCEDVLNEAQQRYTELIKRLKNVDNDILNILHTIELEKTKDMYKGWLLYKDIKINREKRREIKDELLIIENVISEINPKLVSRERTRKAIAGLLGRKYKFRIVEDEEES